MKAVKFSVAAAAALALSTAALAEGPAVYGQINGEVGTFHDYKRDGAVLGGKSIGSRLGIKGTKDLGDGLTGIYNIEWTVDSMNGATANDNRNTFVGLKGGFGTLIVGNHDTPYKIAARGVGTVAHTDATDTLTLNDQRARGAVAYVAPIEGMTLAAAIVPVRSSGTATVDDPEKDGMHMSVGFLMPISDELKVAAGYESLYMPQMSNFVAGYNSIFGTSIKATDIDPAAVDTDALDFTVDFMFVGANYKLGNMTIGGALETISADGEAVATRILVPFTMNMDNGLFVNAALRMTTWDDSDLDATNEIGASAGKKFGKDMEAYVAMKNVSNLGGDKDAAGTDMALGMRVYF